MCRHLVADSNARLYCRAGRMFSSVTSRIFCPDFGEAEQPIQKQMKVPQLTLFS